MGATDRPRISTAVAVPTVMILGVPQGDTLANFPVIFWDFFKGRVCVCVCVNLPCVVSSSSADCTRDRFS